MSPAETPFQLLQGGRGPAARSEVLCRIRTRWGDAAADEVRDRVEAGTDQEADAWLRRSAYFLDLPSTLDLERTLPVSSLRIHELLGLVAADDRPALSLILVRFSTLDARDWRRAEHAAPWLEDIPHSRRAIQHLCTQGWLLVACGNPEQGLALWRSVRRHRGLLAHRYDLAGCSPCHRGPATAFCTATATSKEILE